MKKINITIVVFLLTTFIINAQEKANLSYGDKAPSFIAESTQGKINFPEDYYGKWKILFSHPADFTPVCSSELLELAYMQEEFKKLNTTLIVISTDGINSHIEWAKSLESMNYKDRGTRKIDFPIVADDDKKVSEKYGMINKYSSEKRDIRTVFIVDTNDRIRAMFFYPLEVGRNMNEIKRTVIALQKVDEKNIFTPANWSQGDDVLLPSPATLKDAEKLNEKNDKSLYSYSWYMWFKKQ